MPVLTAANTAPAQLCLGALPPPDLPNSRWYVATTKSQQERALAQDMRDKYIYYFLPMTRGEREAGRQRLSVLSPLLPGYIFFYGPPEVVYSVSEMMPKRVAKIIASDMTNQEMIYRDLERLRRSIMQDGTLKAVNYTEKLRGGEKVIVTEGPMAGEEAIYLRKQSDEVIYVDYQTLGRMTSMRIRPDWIRPVKT